MPARTRVVNLPLTFLALSLLALPAASAGTVREDDFLVKTTGDLMALCSADASEEMMTAAVNFCHGFVVGTYRVLAQEQAALSGAGLFCPPAQLPSRNEAIHNFMEWSKSNPNVMSLPPTDGIAMYLGQVWPCGRK